MADATVVLKNAVLKNVVLANTVQILQQLREHLEQRKVEIYQEISDYPPPIPACDAQFNYLLELRNGVNQELSQINSLLAEDVSSKTVQLFVDASIVLKPKLKREINSLLQNASSQSDDDKLLHFLN